MCHLSLRPPRPNPTQHGVSRPSQIDGHEGFSKQQNSRGRLPKPYAFILSFLPASVSTQTSEWACEVPNGRPTGGAAPPASPLISGRCSPQRLACRHRASSRRCPKLRSMRTTLGCHRWAPALWVSFLDFDKSDPVNNVPMVSPRGHKCMLGFWCGDFFCFDSFLSCSNSNPLPIHAVEL
jgi:hypothetical protein